MVGQEINYYVRSGSSHYNTVLEKGFGTPLKFWTIPYMIMTILLKNPFFLLEKLWLPQTDTNNFMFHFVLFIVDEKKNIAKLKMVFLPWMCV